MSSRSKDPRRRRKGPRSLPEINRLVRWRDAFTDFREPGTLVSWGHYDHGPHEDTHADEAHKDLAHADHLDDGHVDFEHADQQHEDAGHDDAHSDSFGDVHSDE